MAKIILLASGITAMVFFTMLKLPVSIAALIGVWPFGFSFTPTFITWFLGAGVNPEMVGTLHGSIIFVEIIGYFAIKLCLWMRRNEIHNWKKRPDLSLPDMVIVWAHNQACGIKESREKNKRGDAA